MKKAFITGITGTVAPYLRTELTNNGYEVFDKHIRINLDEDLVQLKDYLSEINPDYVFHLAMGPYSYARTLAEYCEVNNKVFVYISTVSVFEDNDGGPYTKETIVKAKSDYGKYKFESEQEVLKVNKNSYIIRIGWQISDKSDSTTNNMFRFIKDNLNDKNEITVSDKFYPSTSFLNDTVDAIRDVVENNDPDLYLVNSNKDKSLYEIIKMLNEDFSLDIKINKDSTFARNDVMMDSRVKINKF